MVFLRFGFSRNHPVDPPAQTAPSNPSHPVLHSTLHRQPPATHQSQHRLQVIPARIPAQGAPSPHDHDLLRAPAARQMPTWALAHGHPHPGARSSAPALSVPLPVFTTAPPPSHFPLTCGSFATPALGSVADIPVSLPLLHSDAHGQGFLFGDGAGGYAGDGVFSLDDLDVGVGVGGAAMMQAEWGDQFWLGDDSV
ncbi:hypothetical protein Asppvi_001530 [Aspergillus pseudoviridinutans]|uniref:Uncharacterized protein n=1 Tax=Aspergillus pseudoviridinutans TaxID=1517512 RepID=A0A9P3B6Y6_9EURO|nr:uncharacterized protein Asppvi_001530 [Aspergillus pseudoviridinutans]GIJ83013.1 hypothetical protein Asppvi_001530 [Aspergillus pseudoviridinutans]